jgi:hypothetical protein
LWPPRQECTSRDGSCAKPLASDGVERHSTLSKDVLKNQYPEKAETSPALFDQSSKAKNDQDLHQRHFHICKKKFE